MSNEHKLVEALKRIAAYPETRATELGYEGCRKIAREALASGAQVQLRASRPYRDFTVFDGDV